MRDQVLTYIESLIVLILIAVGGLTPLIFLDLTTDYYEIPKLIFLFFSTLLLYGFWITSWVLKGSITFRKNLLNVPLLLLMLVVVTSTMFSPSRYISIFGILPEVHGSAISWVIYILLFFIATSNLKAKMHIKVFLQVIVGSALLVSIVSLFSYFQLFLPIDIAKGVNFTPTGSNFSTVAFLLMVLPLSFVSTVKQNDFLPRPLAMILSVVFSITVVLIGLTITYLILFLVFLASIYSVKEHLNETTLPMLLTPFGLSALTIMLAVIPFSGNRLYETRQDFPTEIQLPVSMSWEISASSFGSSPIFGTGPSTYLYNFTRYKPLEFNRLEYWGFRFSSAYNEYLEALGVWGLVGLFSLLFFSIKVLLLVKRNLQSGRSNHPTDESDILIHGLTISSVVSIVLLFIHASSLVSIVISLLLMASYVAVIQQKKVKDSEFSFRIRIKTSTGKRVVPIPALFLILYLVLAVIIGGAAVDAVAADYYHRLALSQAGKDGSKTYEYLQRAEELNPYVDLYRVDMAQTNFALANALVFEKGPTESNPEGSLTEKDSETIQLLLAQAINEGRVAVTLSPRSSRNWEVLGLIYRSITGVSDNSLNFALDAYGRAIQNDPFNPTLRLNVGLIYYSTGNYDQAIRYFTDAINLKPDYVNGYYYLALSLSDKGEIDKAKQAAEQAVELLKNDLSIQQQERVSELLKQEWIKDYSSATELLKEIESKLDGGEAVLESQLQETDILDVQLPESNETIETSAPNVLEDVGGSNADSEITPTPSEQ